MREFNLSHAVTAFSTYTSTLNSLWGLFIVATFSAAGFGASMKGQFSPLVALVLSIAYLAFAAGHLRVLTVTTKKLMVIGDEVCERLDANPTEFTDYPRSVAAILDSSFGLRTIWVIHFAIDVCVLGIIWASAT